MDKKKIVVAGGSSGIGAELAVHLGEKGWDVAINYAGNAAGAEKTVATIRALGQRAFMAKCDVGYKDQVDRFFDDVSADLGIPDLLVNNAGVQTWASFIDLQECDWDRTIRTNLKGSFLCTQKYAKLLIGEGKPGSVVMIGSGSNKVPFPELVDYSVSKGGIENLTQIAATELGKYAIRVNCVAPGAIEIERTRLESPEYAKTWSAVTPLGRVGTTTDISCAVEYFADDLSSYVTGQTLYVDGGVFTRPNWPY